MNAAPEPICPRCGGAIPNNMTPGAYPGALSRWDNDTEICSDCGYEEAIIDWTNGTYREGGSAWLSPTGENPWREPERALSLYDIEQRKKVEG